MGLNKLKEQLQALIGEELQSNRFYRKAPHFNDRVLLEQCKLRHWRMFQHQHAEDPENREFLFHRSINDTAKLVILTIADQTELQKSD